MAAEKGPDSANVPLRSAITGVLLLGMLALLNLAKPFLMPILIVLVLMILRQPATVSAPLPMTNKIVCDHVKPLATIGEFLSDDERKPLDRCLPRPGPAVDLIQTILRSRSRAVRP